MVIPRACGLALFAFYFVLFLFLLLFGFGFGDVKLAGPLGPLLGWLNWTTAVPAMFTTLITAVSLRPG